ncbi:MAG: SCO family protein [Chitinophagales bacterium]|nr:SCO family protein [Chitinophagales bacterium]
MKYLLIFGIGLILTACSETNNDIQPLPYLGNHQIQGKDTIYHTITEFAFTNQDSNTVTNGTFKDKAYIADFFFTSCPTICPKVTKQMLRLYDKYEADDRILFLSHTIDTKRDTVGRLRHYANNLGVSSKKWHFVTGDKDEIYEIADDYMSIATEDPDAPGGFDHSGWLLLIDGQGRIRSFADGTDEEKVNRLMQDIDWMLEHLD